MTNEDLDQFLFGHLKSFALILLKALLQNEQHASSSGVRDSVSSSCRKDLIQLGSNAINNDHWALKVLDSSGRLRSGLLSGSALNSIGNYDECSSIGSTKYCLARISLAAPTKRLPLLAERFLLAPEMLNRSSQVGLCVPASCSSNDIGSLANQIISSSLSSALTIQQLDCHDTLPQSVDAGLLLSLALIAVVIAVSVAATIVDLTNRKRGSRPKQPRWVKELSEVFSIARNCNKLVCKRKALRQVVNLKVLDGLRVISMLWIVVIHSYNFSFQWLLFDNIEQVSGVYKSAWIQWIANGTFSVDNFFLVGGVLAWYKQFEQLRAVKRRSYQTQVASGQRLTLGMLFSNIGNRYSRLVPTMMVIILFSTTLLPHLAKGPNWLSSTFMFDQWCRTNWFLNLFMLHNLVSTSSMCCSHSWYLAVDLQLYALFQLIFFLAEHRPLFKIESRPLFVITVLAAQIMVSSVIYLNRLPSAPLVPADSLESINSYYSLVYVKPFYWLSSYLIGAILASYSFNSRKETLPGNKAAFLVQLPSILLMSGLVLSILPNIRDVSQMSSLQSAAYGFFVRPLWSICLANLLFFAMSKPPTASRKRDSAGVIGRCFSSKVWLPLSRLTYSAYLIHPIIMALFYGSRTETFQFSHSLLLYFTLGNIVITYTCALAIYLFIELPIQNSIRKIKTYLFESQAIQHH